MQCPGVFRPIALNVLDFLLWPGRICGGGHCLHRKLPTSTPQLGLAWRRARSTDLKSMLIFGVASARVCMRLQEVSCCLELVDYPMADLVAVGFNFRTW